MPGRPPAMPAGPGPGEAVNKQVCAGWPLGEQVALRGRGRGPVSAGLSVATGPAAAETPTQRPAGPAQAPTGNRSDTETPGLWPLS